ncbi:hypothetical protein V7087_03000 [Neobacillus niacini]|uniref:hypothetical protein n=1 Tax=Neobacillus niacini TaxID=86668 RepID=UPI002FFECF6C
MNEFVYTKLLGVIVGTLTIFVAIGFGILSFIGIGLSNALNTGTDYSSSSHYILLIFISLILCGFITSIGAFKLKKTVWRIFYMYFCLILGLGFVATFLISFGSIGSKNEILLLSVGMVYLLLGYLVKKKK